MSLLKQLAFDNWHEVTVENLDSWIQKVHKLKKKDFQKHVVFSEMELERELHDIKNQNKYRSKLDYNLGYLFGLKCELLRNPLRVLSILLFLSIGFFGLCLYIFERYLNNFRNYDFNKLFAEDTYKSFSNYFNCCWCIILSMSTSNMLMKVGYGDIFPNTILGRITIVFAIIIGMLLSALFVVGI